MRTNARLFWGLAAFFALMAVIYTVWSVIDPFTGSVEWAGTFALSLSAVLAAFIGFYLGKVYTAQGGETPEDRLDANIDDGDAESGFFSPWSWWPIVLAASAALVFLGLAVGIWVAFIGLAFGVIGLVGWVYEYYRGLFAR
ncbi:cytochrome c oxidase subunit 4 [Cryobacterium psychrophilum]|uniref:Cytochrome c oxidase polypeptide 4 n=1 Tax=Cryobacterium psychrophilum TaxID=41988 RepID=A0A4Y8KQP8_9MICO|nr:cytochrome c oxidase subunit 4 [Cryobacterium psychrophilum]TDW28487.1 cytochrome c oxidase subunit IV [Cryobacterium psychrophilum]TFD80509.1 cytochrome c oxidase subunit 4 [Cryobacterium psychrophilum]